MIDIRNLAFSYDKKIILKDINFIVEEPAIIALWGRNGSGKTTLMKMISGQEKPCDGNIKIKGIEPYNNAKVVSDICFIQEDHPFSSIWSVNDALRFAKQFNSNWNQEEAEYLIKKFNLPLNKKIVKFSKGMKTAVQIVIGLASNADVTILDEPTNGLDADMRKKFYKALKDSFDSNPRVILLSTHHIEEAQPICDSLIVIHNNSLLFHKSLDEIRSNGILFTGESDNIESFVKGKKVIEKSVLGSTTRVMVDLPYTKELKQLAEKNDILIQKAPIQDYLLNITTN